MSYVDTEPDDSVLGVYALSIAYQSYAKGISMGCFSCADLINFHDGRRNLMYTLLTFSWESL